MNVLLERINQLPPDKRQQLLDQIKSKMASKQPHQKILPQPREAGENRFPLSYSQQRLWFVHQWEPDSPSYNIPCVFEFQREVEAALLEKAVHTIIERHEVLRTTYHTVEEEPVQTVHPFSPIGLQVIDLQQLPQEEKRRKRDALIKEKALEPFRLEQQFPIKAYLFTLNPDEHTLLLNVHHIACDGWSIGIIQDEIMQAYTAYTRNKPLELPELPVQYADFASWQRNYLIGDVLRYHQDYWCEKFQGDIPVLELPTDKPRPPVKSMRGADIQRPIGKGAEAAIKRFCQEEDVTLYMAMMAAYAILLSRYSGQSDIIIGSPIASRNREEIERNVGFFVNTLPIRIQLDEQASFRETAKQVKRLTVEASEHQDLPLDKIMEPLHLERNMSHSPLFQVMLVLQNMHMWGEETEELPMQFFGSRNTDSSKFDLTFSISPGIVHAEYSTDIFEEATIARMLGHYTHLLEQACMDPEQAIVNIPLMPEAEKEQIAVLWNETKLPHDPGYHLVAAIEAQADRHPQRAALACEGRSFTYAEMNRRANQLAHYLIAQQVGPGQAVGIFMERTADVAIAMLAVLKAGGAYVPIDPSYPKDRVQYMIQASGMRVLITQAKLSADIDPQGAALLDYDRDRRSYESMSGENPAIRTTPDDLMYMIFTSGTTGMPKGVGVELRQFHNYILGITKHLNIQEPLSYALASTFAADLGTTNIYGALCTGGTLHVLTYERSCDPDGVADYFQKHRIDIMKVVPSHFEVLMSAEQPEHVIPHRTLILAGEGLSWETVAKIRKLRPSCDIQNHYGPTETTVSAMAYPLPSELKEHAGNSMVPIGKPIGNVQAYVLDAHHHPAPIGVPGELYIGGSGVSRGYIHNPELNESRFLLNPFRKGSGEQLYRTGDRVKWLPDGNIEILGRMDRQIKIRGFRIELGEIESAITACPFVKDAAVLVKEDRKGDKRIAAYLVFEPAHSCEAPLTELKKILKQKLPEYMIPTYMMEMEGLPLTPNGKVDQALLSSMELSLAPSPSSALEPETETEKSILAIWKDVLELDVIGMEDSFFELGGDSFKALKAVRRLGDWIGIMDFFKHPTIRSMAEYMDSGQQAEHGLIHRLTSQSNQETVHVSFVCVPYAGGSAITYQPLAAQMPEGIALYAVDIPGHEYTRKSEELLSIQEVARMCVDEMAASIQGQIVLYGHCVGGALTVEIARELEARELPLQRVFLGGTFPIARMPGRLFNLFSKLFPSDRSMSNKSYHEFLKALGGFTEVDDMAERDFMIRCLRHDARESENYYTMAYSESRWNKLKAPITCIVGERDRATEFYEERFKEWEYFSERVDLAIVPQAGHYFLKHQAKLLSEMMGVAIQASSPTREANAEWMLAEQAIASGAEQAAAARHADSAALSSNRKQKKSAVPNLRMFMIVVIGQLLSVFGSGLTGIAVGVWIFSQTGAVSDFAAISAASLIPGILALPFAGAIVDRYDRRLVMLYSDIMMALPLIALAILMATNSLEVWHIYITSAISSVTRSFHRPAFVASMTQIIPKQYLGHANGIVQLAGATSELIAPLIGVALYAWIGMTNIFLLDLVSFAFAIISLAMIRFPNTLFHRQEEPFFKEMLMGWKFIARRPALLYMIAFFLIGNILFGLATVLIQPLVLSFGSPNDLATVSMLGAIGTMAGGLVMSLWGGTARRATGMVGFVILEGFFMIIAGLQPSLISTAVGIFGLWFSVTLVNAHWQALIQSKVGLELQGRVFATNQMIAMSSMPVGYLLAGVLADSVFGKAMSESGFLADLFGPIIGTGAGRGIGLLIICVGVLVMVWSTIGFNFKPLRYMEDSLEDAIPGAEIADKDTLQSKLDHRIAGKAVAFKENNVSA
ncbi:non-ribosomal peptide synthetase/MFS transporter [Paenibacillus sp. MMS18-CY102]|uniref:non-ribosomal peptide synthetase/MFS transporter n=1 Tax=Paenibacillus sp. MMS18-CY102 TaxID=2682849 RepID=UPI0013666EE1|nr:non-ribosomal peptide synthetase/MFS transporter [Paenibacillus sp. MMS18-CY102]MWC29594.1 amino acid adenylation domain-containing protein [Paenibacillus sp. MMS18-CY102]